MVNSVANAVKKVNNHLTSVRKSSKGPVDTSIDDTVTVPKVTSSASLPGTHSRDNSASSAGSNLRALSPTVNLSSGTRSISISKRNFLGVGRRSSPEEVTTASNSSSAPRYTSAAAHDDANNLHLPPLPSGSLAHSSPRPSPPVSRSSLDGCTPPSSPPPPSQQVLRRKSTGETESLIRQTRFNGASRSPTSLLSTAAATGRPPPIRTSSKDHSNQQAIYRRLNVLYPDSTMLGPRGRAECQKGYLLKRSTGNRAAVSISSKIWNKRYFVLRHSTLLWYVRENDRESKGNLELLPDSTIVTAIRSKMKTFHKKKTVIHMFKIMVFPDRECMDEYQHGGDSGGPESPSAGAAAADEDFEREPSRSQATTNLQANTCDSPFTSGPDLSNKFSEDSFDEDNFIQKRTASEEAAEKTQSKPKKKTRKHKALARGTQVATASGVLAGVVGFTVLPIIFPPLSIIVATAAAAGVGAGGSGIMSARSYKAKSAPVSLVMASQNHEEISQWRDAVVAALAESNSRMEMEKERQRTQMEAPRSRGMGAELTLARFFKDDGQALGPENKNEDQGDILSGRSSGQARRRKLVTKLDAAETYIQSSQWRLLEGGWANMLGRGTNGMRVFEEYMDSEENSPFVRRRRVSVQGRPCPPLRGSVILNATPDDAFTTLMCYTNTSRNIGNYKLIQKGRHSFEIIERLDQHSDIIRLEYDPLYLFPSWTVPRDFCVLRYWRQDDDGSYVICMDSITHRECPSQPTHIRGNLHGVYTVTPLKGNQPNANTECLLTCIVQVDPKGWIPTFSLSSNQSYADAYSVAAILQLLDIRDVIDHDRFLPVGYDPQGIAHDNYSVNSEEEDSQFSYPLQDQLENEDPGDVDDPRVCVALHPPALPQKYWSEPDANKFQVRGKTYKSDKIKVKAGSPALQLFAVDLVEVAAPIMTGMCKHPKERIQQALEREKMGYENDLAPFIFVVNIIIPGSKYYHLVMYYAAHEMSMVDGTDGTEFSKLVSTIPL